MNFIIPDNIIISFIQHLDFKNRLVWSSLYPMESAELQAKLTRFRNNWHCQCCHRHQRNRGRIITPPVGPSSRFYRLKHYLVENGRLCGCSCRSECRMFLRDCLGLPYVVTLYHQGHDVNLIRLWQPYHEFPGLRWLARQKLYFKDLTDPTIEQRIADIDSHVGMVDEFIDHARVAQQEDHRKLPPMVVEFGGDVPDIN